MVAGELAHLAGEVDAAIGDQDFGFADAAGIEDDLARRGITGLVFVTDPKIEIAKRQPDGFAAPAHVHRFADERQGLLEGVTGPGCQFGFEPGLEREGARSQDQVGHDQAFARA